MTKEQYLEMCEMLGSEPDELEMPVDFTDFPELVQQTLNLYNLLLDHWDGMSGVFFGKRLEGIFDLFKVYEIVDYEQLYALNIIKHLDSVRSKIYAEQREAQQKASATKKS
jgi:hypothetical protein